MTQAVPIIAAKAPAKVELEEGKDYFWCRCGRSGLNRSAMAATQVPESRR